MVQTAKPRQPLLGCVSPLKKKRRAWLHEFSISHSFCPGGRTCRGQRAVGCCPLQPGWDPQRLAKEGPKVPPGWEGSRGIPWSRANDCVTNKTIAYRVTPPEFPSPNRKLELDSRHQIFWPVSDRLTGDRAPDAIFPGCALSLCPWPTSLLLLASFALHDEQR